ncbi:MAG: cytochrome C oxidase subunit IV family protein [Gemmatimonadetes bacterium]|nr:cytochrome C oxidase subunit IV family protein [Gemmatimonadota bacterium]
MSIELHCPQCEKLIKAPDTAGGRHGKCPYCGRDVYIPAISATAALAPVLLVLSAAKFALVVMFFMHLKPDSKIFTIIFTAPLLLAGLMILALMTLLGAWWLG